jgi:polyisoprenyl-phosphate glycosyltransferase
MIENKTISAIIACYRDGQAIPIMYERLTKVFRKIGCDYEIIFVNDGSPDNSQEVLEKICASDSKVTAVTHTRNFSSQHAFTSGMIQSIGDAVVLLDGDLQDPPELIERFAEKWAEGFEVVYGIRVKREASRFLQIAYKLFYRVFQKMSYIKIPVDAGDFSLMDRKVVDALNSMPENDRFMRGMRAWVGFKQTGVPYKRPERMFGRTTNNMTGNIRWARKGIFSFSYVPLELVSYLSYFVVVLSVIGIIFYLVSYFVYPDGPKGITTIIILVLFLGGIQLLSLSIIGEYVGKIFEETKRRPKFIVKSILNNHRTKDKDNDIN